MKKVSRVINLSLLKKTDEMSKPTKFVAYYTLLYYKVWIEAKKERDRESESHILPVYNFFSNRCWSAKLFHSVCRIDRSFPPSFLIRH